MTIAYTTTKGKYARTYNATVGDLVVELEKTNPEYLGWCIFIERVVGDETVTAYHSYSQTLAEAKERASIFVVSDQLLATV